jgi:hypothetical protein
MIVGVILLLASSVSSFASQIHQHTLATGKVSRELTLDDTNKGAKIPLINTKEQANKIVEWLKAIQTNREAILAKAAALSKDVDNITSSINQFKATGDQLDAVIAELLSLICVILMKVVVNGYRVIENNYEKYSQLLTAYHAESVKEYGIS